MKRTVLAAYALVALSGCLVADRAPLVLSGVDCGPAAIYDINYLTDLFNKDVWNGGYHRRTFLNEADTAKLVAALRADPSGTKVSDEGAPLDGIPPDAITFLGAYHDREEYQRFALAAFVVEDCVVSISRTAPHIAKARLIEAGLAVPPFLQ